jgi:LL-diaminopimelate aminotransferase
MMNINRRLNALPPYLLADLDRRKGQAAARGVDVIDLCAGDLDLPTPAPIAERAAAALKGGGAPASSGGKPLREAVARWYGRRFGVGLDPETEIALLIGAKEGLGRLPAALVDEGQPVLIPDPSRPVYRAGSILAGLDVRELPLTPANGFHPDLAHVSKELAYRAKLLFINYPNNPTGAAADSAFFQTAADWAVRHQVWVAHDASYRELAFGSSHPSFLQAKGAREIGLEFCDAWGVGFAAGNRQAVSALERVAAGSGSGAYAAAQEAAAWALDHGDELTAEHRSVYAARKSEFERGLEKAGWEVFPSSATYYAWARTPNRLPSKACAEQLLEEAAVFAAPGVGFGPSGEGFLRFALTVPEARLEEALRRIARVDWAVRSIPQ